MTGARPDYPAAHSMDTDWFAVDADGNVGFFKSGEDGAVPAGWGFTQDSGWDLIERLALEAAEAIWSNGSVRGVHCWSTPPADQELARAFGGFCNVMFLRHPPDADFREHKAAAPIRVDGGTLYPVFVGIIYDEEYDQLHTSGACAGCGCVDVGRLANLGFFQFHCDKYGVPPYERLGVPQTPLRLDELSPALRELLQSKRIATADFARAQKFQPLEHVPCDTWSTGTYVGTDGQTHPLPPRPGQDAKPATPQAAPPTPAAIAQAKPAAPAPARRWWQFWRR
jgi:hypothetical protein